MSNDFYFKTWRATLERLENIIDIDIRYQVTKAHDQNLADAVHRLTSILGQYMTIYNEQVECVHNNLQVQKTTYLVNILKAVVARIEEMKRDLQKIEGSCYVFFGSGLIMFKQTTYDAEMKEIPIKTTRLPPIQAAIDNAFQRVREIKEALSKVKEEEAVEVKKVIPPNPFDVEPEEEEEILVEEKVKEAIPEEVRIRRDLLNKIIAQEKTRQVISANRRKKRRREVWFKELKGTAPRPARYELRERSAKLIQKVIRAYFEIKRQRIRDCKLDQILGLNYCEILHPKPEIIQKPNNRLELHDNYKRECLEERAKLKEEYKKWKGQELSEDCCDRIRNWFHEWFESIQFIHDIPNPGCTTIFQDEVPDPHEWLEEYKALMKEKEDSKGKSPQQLKYEAQEKKRLEKEAKKVAQKQQKAEAALQLKMMKHPTMHPGYFYPQSKKTAPLVEAIKSYHTAWDFYDAEELPEVKKKYIPELNTEDAYMDAKLEILKEVDEHMAKEHQQLKKALRADYNRHDQVMPVQATVRKVKKQKKLMKIPSEQIANNIEILALDGWIIDYPETKLDDFIGDPNFAGEDLRREIRPASPYMYEVRSLWWERCNGVAQGSRRILLVGPDGSGKIKLVHAMASINDAVLFEMDPLTVPQETLTPANLKKLMKNILSCAKAIQPSILHIRHVEKLFYIKEPPEEANLHLAYLKKFFLLRLLKKIHKRDKITIIGSSNTPWVARANQLLKLFPIVILLPNTSYSVVVQMLRNCIMEKFHKIPFNFELGCLAYMLQGYSFGSLQEALNRFMSDEKIVRTAAYGLSAMEVYNYILEDQSLEKIEYDRYLKWYWEKTSIGMKEKQHFDGMLEYKAAVAAYEAKEAKKAKIAKKHAAVVANAAK